MKFIAVDSSKAGGKITIGGIYVGQFIYVGNVNPGLRLIVYDNHKVWSGHPPEMFKPYIEKTKEETKR